MFKKNSWIVALLVALSFSIFFIGCVDPLVEDNGDGDETYTEFELTGFNLWGGNAENQAGWGTDGATYSNGKKTVASIGLTVEMLQNAKYLVLEMNDGYPKNNVETIYDSWAADGTQLGSWQQLSTFATGAGVPIPGLGAKQEGNTYTLELSKVLKNYGTFIDKDTAAISLYIQHWGNGGTVAAIKSAKLLIAEPKFVPVTSITIPAISGYQDNGITLTAEVAPLDASLQKVIWSIVSFLPQGGVAATDTLTIDNTSTATYNSSKAALLAKVDFKAIDSVLIPGYNYDDYSVYPPVTVTVSPITGDRGLKSPNIIIATEPGTVTVKAIILEAGADGVDFTKDATVTVNPFTPYVVPADGSSFFYVDLNEYDSTGATDASGITYVPGVQTIPAKATVAFTRDNERVIFKFTAAQKAILDGLGASGSVKVTINASVVSGGTGDLFRYHIGNALAGSGWNGTGSPGGDNGTLASKGDLVVAFANDTADRTHFILQHRNGDAVTIDITSIIITYKTFGVTVDNAVQQQYVYAKNGVADALGDGTGYSIAFNGGYGNSYAQFKVNFGATDKLSDFARIEFDYLGTAGDIGYKTIKIFAFDAMIYPSGYFDTGANDANLIASQAYSNDGTATIAVSQTIDATKAATITTGEVWFSITLHSNPATFQISNIKFVK